ncbi:MAG: sulfotransferase [Planctomycetota bacterium]
MNDGLLAREAGFRVGRGLCFVLGAFRGGTTLLRKVLDTHPGVYSPAETWFMLPLVNLWEGVGENSRFNPKQAGVAIQQHLKQEQFVECCRAFAGRFYAEALAGSPKSSAGVFVDKTPLYLQLAGALPVVFPEAEFVVLARDPRGILWSRHTWQHSGPEPIESRIPVVAGDVQKLAAFWAARERVGADRVHLVKYEELCTEPESAARGLCGFLGVEFEARMVDYGAALHHEGYGDEKSRGHSRPHTGSVERWRGEMSEVVQGEVARACGGEALGVLGYGELAGLVTAVA